MSGCRSHSQEVAAFMSVPGLLTPNTTPATRLSLSLVGFRFGHLVPLSKDGISQRQRGVTFLSGLYVPSPVVAMGGREGGTNSKPSPHHLQLRV